VTNAISKAQRMSKAETPPDASTLARSIVRSLAWAAAPAPAQLRPSTSFVRDSRHVWSSTAMLLDLQAERTEHRVDASPSPLNLIPNR